jgi:hypothetical protein
MEGLVGGAEIISAYTRERLRRQVPRGQITLAVVAV